jgi:4'-phosphopantetheinyl transferase
MEKTEAMHQPLQIDREIPARLTCKECTALKNTSLHEIMLTADDPLLGFKELSNQVHIWAVDLEHWGFPCHEAMQMLPESERKQSERFRFEILKTRYIKGHYLLRSLLGMYLGIDFYDQEFHIHKYGKPSLKNTQAEDSIYFNMSNSKNTCICVFRQHGDIGVDVEKIHELSNLDRIVERFFSPLERKKIRSLSEQSRKKTFFKYWTRKEALLKAMGVGLSFPLDKVDVTDDQEETAEAFVKTTGLHAESEWTLKDINVFEGFASAIALQGNHLDCAPRLRYFQVSDENAVL